MWTLDELKQAAPYFHGRWVAIDGRLSDDQITHRYLHFGGVPRHVFAGKTGYKAIKEEQTRALQFLTSEQAKSIVLGTLDWDSRGISLHRGVLLGFVHDPQYNYRYVTAISLMVERFAHIKYMKVIWDTVCNGKGNSEAFEKYCMLLFIGDTKVQMTSRQIVGPGTRKHVHNNKGTFWEAAKT
jgi:hypothetical protein